MRKAGLTMAQAPQRTADQGPSVQPGFARAAVALTPARAPVPPRAPRALLPLVFLAGIGSMATEICASRLLAPFYGSSTVVWANIIGLILAALALGYWLGGRMADAHPSARLLGFVVLAAAALIAAVPFVARPFLDLSIGSLERLSAGAVVGSFAASLALFAPPVVLLGMVTPFAIRLAVTDVDGAGVVAGRVFALSTAGSLLGTFVPALFTIPLIGTQRTLLGAAAIVALAAATLLGRRWFLAAAVVALLLAVPPGLVKAEAGVLYEGESRYQFIEVVQQGRGAGAVRYLYLNEGYAVHSVWRPNTVLTGGEWDMFLTLPALLARPPRHVVMLGDAAGTTARAYGALYPGVAYDGVEIDPQVSAVARRYFGLGAVPRLTVYNADARPYLQATTKRYDLIMIDAYRQPYVPFYLATREFFALCRKRLAPGGVVALNVSTVPGDPRLVDGIAGTLATEFPQVVVWPALRFNDLVIGLSTPVPLAELRRRIAGAAVPAAVRSLTRLLAAQMRPRGPAAHPWTDDRAPVEWITDAMIVDYAARGRQIAEQSLPTAP
jgi:spermidine synthase